MAEQITLDPKDYSEQTLKQAINGEISAIKPQLAVVLLTAKLGAAAEPHLIASASDKDLDVRVRLAAISSGSLTVNISLSSIQIEPAPTVSLALPTNPFNLVSNPAAGTKATVTHAAAGA